MTDYRTSETDARASDAPPACGMSAGFKLQVESLDEGGNEAVVVLVEPSGERRPLGAHFAHQIPERPAIEVGEDAVPRPRGEPVGTVAAPTRFCKLEPDGIEHLHLLWHDDGADDGSPLTLTCVKRSPWDCGKAYPPGPEEGYLVYTASGVPSLKDREHLRHELTGLDVLRERASELEGYEKRLAALPALYETIAYLERTPAEEWPADQQWADAMPLDGVSLARLLGTTLGRLGEGLENLRRRHPEGERPAEVEAVAHKFGWYGSGRDVDDLHDDLPSEEYVRGGPEEPSPQEVVRSIKSRSPDGRRETLAALHREAGRLPEVLGEELAGYLPESRTPQAARESFERLRQDAATAAEDPQRFMQGWHELFDGMAALGRVYLI